MFLLSMLGWVTMADYQNAEEVRQYYIDEMGESLGILFWHLRNEVTWLSTHWQEYVELFGTSRERVELLNRSAAGFFRMLQDMLWDETALHVARLTDYPGNGKKARLTIRLLPDRVAAELKSAVEAKIADIDKKAAFCRDRRNRRIAHTSLKLVMAEGAEPLQPGSLNAMNEVVEALEDLLGHIAEHHLHVSMSFRISRITGARLLMRRLQTAQRAEEMVKEQVGRGEVPNFFLRSREI
jgi:hypothetical protein